jgi:hypothetical protein
VVAEQVVGDLQRRQLQLDRPEELRGLGLRREACRRLLWPIITRQAALSAAGRTAAQWHLSPKTVRAVAV